MAEILLSHFQADELIEGERRGLAQIESSIDLGVTRCQAELTPDGVQFPTHQEIIPWSAVHQIADNENNCFYFDQQVPLKLVSYSEATQRAYSLFPTRRAPALLLSGVTMHRIKGIDPSEDTERKIRAISPVTGRILDTATGLGYTAIAAAQTADHVTTIELDPVVLDLARRNPWSHALFENPRITRVIGDTSELALHWADGEFHCVLHDPPMVTIAGEMFATKLYQHFLRILRAGGKLFHYVGDPESPGGRTTTEGVMRRLRDVGFRRVAARPEAFGIVAAK